MFTKSRGFPLLAIVIIVTAISVMYFFLWRPSDSAIEHALSDISTLQKSATSTMPQALKSLSTPAGITTETAERFKQRVTTYVDALDSLERSAAIQKNSSTKTIFETNRPTLIDYGQQLTALSESMSLYGSILKACDAMAASLSSASTISDFDDKSDACTEALDRAGSSQNQTFNESFLHNYVSGAKDMLSAYRQYSAALNSNDNAKRATSELAIDKARDNLRQFLSADIDYRITTPSPDVFKDITNALNDQKRSFFR